MIGANSFLMILLSQSFLYTSAHESTLHKGHQSRKIFDGKDFYYDPESGFYRSKTIMIVNTESTRDFVVPAWFNRVELYNVQETTGRVVVQNSACIIVRIRDK